MEALDRVVLEIPIEQRIRLEPQSRISPRFLAFQAVCSASSIVCGYVEISTTSSGFGRRLPFTMLFANVCELTMGSPGPVCSSGRNRIPGRRCQGREESVR